MRNDGKRFKQLCKFLLFNSRILTRVSVKALFSAVRETSLMRLLAVPGAPVHTTVLGGCAPLSCAFPDVNAPAGRPERAVERNRILEFSSKISLNTLKYYIYVRVNFAKVLPLLS